MKKTRYALILAAVLLVICTCAGMVSCTYDDMRTDAGYWEHKENIQEEEPETEEPEPQPAESENIPTEEEPKEEETPAEEPEKVDKYENLSYKKLKGSDERTICVDRQDDSMFVLEKDPDEDFVIVNLSDIQIASYLVEMIDGGITMNTIKDAINTYHPDLITMSGDQAWSPTTGVNYVNLARLFDGFGIPWAMVFGNHECQFADLHELGAIVSSSAFGMFAESENCDGVGNYSINIVERGTENIVHSVIMMDSGSLGENNGDNLYYYAEPGTALPEELSAYSSQYNQDTGVLEYDDVYAELSEKSIAWYESRVNAIEAKQGGSVETTCIFHIAIPEFLIAYADYAFGDDAVKAAMLPEGNMHMGETIGMGRVNNGMFAKILELGSTKNVIVGHDHYNDYSLVYNGVRLSYSVKAGTGGYWDTSGEVNGCTVLTIDGNGTGTIHQHYYNPED